MVARIGPVLRVSMRTRRQTEVAPSIFYSAGLECHIDRGKTNDLASARPHAALEK